MYCRPRQLLLVATAFLFAVPIEAQTSAASGDADLGKQAFSTCAVCHGLDGRGGEHAPNIATDPKIQRLSDNALLAIIRNGIPAEGMPSFRKFWKDEKIRAVLQYLRTLQGSKDTTVETGNANQGSDSFFGRAGCSACHMIEGRGTFLATDLSAYGTGRNATAIREAIVAPEKNVDPRHGIVSVLTRSAKKYCGAVRNEDNFTLQMQTADGPGITAHPLPSTRAKHEEYKSKKFHR